MNWITGQSVDESLTSRIELDYIVNERIVEGFQTHISPAPRYPGALEGCIYSPRPNDLSNLDLIYRQVGTA
jgi:hypothetical protein